MATSPAFKKTAAGAGIAAAIIAFTAPWEGERHVAYQDPVGIWTICDGETKDVRPGEQRTHAQCLADMQKRVPQYLAQVDKLMPGLPDTKRIAYSDLAWNAGAGILSVRHKEQGHPVPGTSIVDLERAGKGDEACHRITVFVYAGGKVLPGIVKRRKAEEQLCLRKN